MMSGPLRVYLVEDSPILRKLLSDAILAAGATVAGWSGNASDAIANLLALQPDVIIIDISLAEGTGFDVMRAVHGHDWASSAITIVLTNHATPEYEELSNQCGADWFFDKSYQISDALRLIGGIAKQSRYSQEQITPIGPGFYPILTPPH